MARRTRPAVEHVTVHGHRRAFVRAGSGPAVLLLHGLACDHTTWEPVIASLARTHTVIAPDLLGHGESDKPRADYSVGGYANGMRDLLTVLGIDTVTVVGHSFGGGVAMQFAYQFPERTERLVLVSSGGLGPEVTPAIRAITTPGFQQVMGVLTTPVLRRPATAALRLLARSGVSQLRDLDEVASIYETFTDPQARAAIRTVVRSVVDWRGQVVTMADRAYLTEAMPMCVIWGADDVVIPVAHASNAGALAPTARVEVIPKAGHFPHKDHPQRFVKIVRDFIRTTEPSTYDAGRWRELLDQGAPVGPVHAGAGESPRSPVVVVRRAKPA
ncbi:Pimeloyl-ACP methyl ester carboxylesterase [Nocardioides exalbidus]|uniref:Pimeloyl-ACP methyl ester carboxylesterase n=1 Tax=Nocardioides exalbidus TaxID=402596 RepID=A0A1H4W464_9ACTN|nr:alpha/beta fold hydrolase [Nocardioides exalbidus]SEC87421.1 Pimeloyl-ACP methyl ester carboxylesterase [Nocardioides exalbidus]